MNKKKNYSYLCQLIHEKFNFQINDKKMKQICDFLYSDGNMMITNNLNKKLNIKKDILIRHTLHLILLALLIYNV